MGKPSQVGCVSTFLLCLLFQWSAYFFPVSFGGRALSDSSATFRLPIFAHTSRSRSSLLHSPALRSPNKTRITSSKVSIMSLDYTTVTLLSEITIGTPPQRQRVVLDTGSELSWLYCSTSSLNSSYIPARSSTYRTLSCNSSVCTQTASDLSVPPSCDGKQLCHFTTAYADGSSVEGTLASDLLQTPLSRSIVFGCASSALRDTPGLIGLNKGALSLMSQLQGGSSKATFSMCIASGGAQGALILGDDGLPNNVRSLLHYTPMAAPPTKGWSPPYFDKEAYSVTMEGIKVGNTLLPIPKSVFEPDHTGAGQTMIDSATHFTLLLGDAYTPLRQEFIRQNSQVLGSPLANNFVYEGALDLCYSRPTGATSPFELKLTGVTLLLDSLELNLEGRRLLFEVPSKEANSKDRIFCLAFGNSDLVAVEANIIGNHHQQDMWLRYDLPNSRLGFADTGCSAA